MSERIGGLGALEVGNLAQTINQLPQGVNGCAAKACKNASSARARKLSCARQSIIHLRSRILKCEHFFQMYNFGPVLTATRFEEGDEAVAIANGLG
jgi:hypothetical protein